MESNSLPSGMYPNMGPRMQGLEMSLQHHHLSQNPTTQMAAAAAAYPNHHRDYDQQQQQQPGPTQFPAVQDYAFTAKPKIQTFTLSDDDEPGHTPTMENSVDDGKRTSSSSPWQRMKWTDQMVRLLIAAVYYIGDEVCSEGNSDQSAGKKRNSAVLQKKGKWKSVSMAMMEKGFYVSPQQCEDKFNDLNKRYKRVNDILGKGTACKVVENQSLLETMDLTPKLKEEVKKLLNSKHLFFKEMCIYHNTCGHSTTGGGNQQSPDAITEQSISVQHPPQRPQRQPQQRQYSKEENDDEEDDDDDEDEDIDYDEDDVIDDKLSRKRRRTGGVDDSQVAVSPSGQNFNSELKNVLQDETKSLVEKRQWMKARLMQLEEQHMGYDYQALELEKQRLKWLKYSSKKEREMDRDKLINERKKLKNERMMLLIRQKEIDLTGHLHQHQHQHQHQQPNRQSSSRTD